MANDEPAAGSHLHAVVMGVAGSGKSTVAQAISAELGLPMAEGDELHPRANIAKMRAGIPLDDGDRAPWLAALARWAGDRHRAGEGSVMTCSALKRSYRDVLRRAVPEPTVFVHLVGSRDVLAARLTGRSHFMPATLLGSQIDAVEQLDADEDGDEIGADPPLADVVRAALDLVRRYDRQ